MTVHKFVVQYDPSNIIAPFRMTKVESKPDGTPYAFQMELPDGDEILFYPAPELPPMPRGLAEMLYKEFVNNIASRAVMLGAPYPLAHDATEPLAYLIEDHRFDVLGGAGFIIITGKEGDEGVYVRADPFVFQPGSISREQIFAAFTASGFVVEEDTDGMEESHAAEVYAFTMIHPSAGDIDRDRVIAAFMFLIETRNNEGVSEMFPDAPPGSDLVQ